MCEWARPALISSTVTHPATRISCSSQSEYASLSLHCSVSSPYLLDAPHRRLLLAIRSLQPELALLLCLLHYERRRGNYTQNSLRQRLS